MSYSNQSSEAVSTVQLSPFNEGQWHRLVTYAPQYIDWSDTMTMNQQHRSTSGGRLNVLGSIDINSLKLEDALLLKELQSFRRVAAMPPVSTLKERKTHHESRRYDDEQERRTTTPADEYERSSDIFYQTRELSLPHGPVPEKQTSFHSQTVPPPNTSNGLKETSFNVNHPSKLEASLRVQLRQSAQAREHALALNSDRRSISPLSMSSSRRAVGGISHSSRRPRQLFRPLFAYTPAPTEASLVGTLKEEPAADLASPSSARKPSSRHKNTSRTSMHMLKTRNDRTKQKQNVELKTVLVKPCRQPHLQDCGLDEAIPSSIEIMRRIGGPITAFEHTLRHSYHRHLSQFRNGSIVC